MTNGRIRIPKEYDSIKESSKGIAGFMGLSIGKKEFYNKRIVESYAAFMSEHFSRAFFFISDFPKVHNIHAIENIFGDKAFRRVNISSIELAHFVNSIISSFPNIEVLQFSGMRYELDAYRGNLSNLNNQYFIQKQKVVLVDQSFYKDCEKAIREFLTIPTNLAKIKANPYNSLEQAIYHAFPGYLEELAMLLTLPRWRRLGNNEQYPVCEIYPGKSEVQDKLQRGAYNLYELCKYLIINPKYMYMEAYYEPPNS